MSGPKPFVQAACVCEKVLVETDTVPSVIRMVDTFFLEELPEPFPPNLKKVLDLTVFVSLRSGDVVGEHEIGLRLISPDQEAQPARRWPVEFGGAETGVNLRVAFRLTEPKFGLYWFDVLWGDEVLTRIPLRLKPKVSESTVEAKTPTETVTH